MRECKTVTAVIKPVLEIPDARVVTESLSVLSVDTVNTVESPTKVPTTISAFSYLFSVHPGLVKINTVRMGIE